MKNQEGEAGGTMLVAVQQAGPNEYALGHSDRELDRLSMQAQTFDAFTRQLLREAGLGSGMRVLDVGCGSGDVAFLAAQLVGPTGCVIGVDRTAAAIARGRSRAESKRISNVHFVEGDPTQMKFDKDFDALVGRLILMYYPDPVDALRKLLPHLRPGGIVVFQEIDASGCKSHPVSPTYQRCVDWITQTFHLTGAQTQAGLELPRTFQSAGLPAPTLRLDAAVGAGPDTPAYKMLPEIVRSLLPAMERLGIATAAEVEVESLALRIRDEVVANNGIVISPSLIGAWATHETATIKRNGNPIPKSMNELRSRFTNVRSRGLVLPR
jgi:ubiquinone/menaquinone biosynthesis C-methylase UbiE